jgi:hypothetical protein
VRSKRPETRTPGTSPPDVDRPSSSDAITSSSTGRRSESTTGAVAIRDSAPPLRYDEAERTVAQLDEVVDEIVLVGGQGQGFWVGQYADTVPELQADLAAHGPLTSRDIDFLGSRAAAERCAQRLAGRLQVADIDHATPNPLVVHYTDGRGHLRLIDFLSALHGIRRTADVYDTAVVVDFLAPDLAAAGRHFRVGHPVLLMESRISNVVDLRKYQTEHGRRQARAAILCAREYARRRIEAGAVKEVCRMYERIFRFRSSPTGRTAAGREGLDAFAAILVDPGLPESFRTIRYSQMQRELARVRKGQGLER